MHGSADLASSHRRLAGALMTRDQQDDSLATGKGALQSLVDRPPGAVQIHSMKVEDSVGFDRTRAKSLVPAAVQGRPDPGARNRCRRLHRPSLNRLRLRFDSRSFYFCF